MINDSAWALACACPPSVTLMLSPSSARRSGGRALASCQEWRPRWSVVGVVMPNPSYHTTNSIPGDSSCDSSSRMTMSYPISTSVSSFCWWVRSANLTAGLAWMAWCDGMMLTGALSPAKAPSNQSNPSAGAAVHTQAPKLIAPHQAHTSSSTQTVRSVHVEGLPIPWCIASC